MPKLKPTIEANPENLVTVKKAAEILGTGFSRSSIMRRIESGEWVEGFHWIDDRRMGALRRVIKINLSEVQKHRTIPAGER
jgi:hypothetical protein